MAANFNTFNEWVPAAKNHLKDPYWEDFDIYRYSAPDERSTSITISKVPCGLYRDRLLYLNLLIRVDAKVDEPQTRRSIARALKELFKVRKCICVIDSQKIVRQQRWFVLCQFYCRPDERPSEAVMEKVQGAAFDAVVYQDIEDTPVASPEVPNSADN